jgi:hypothetical protein
MSAWPDGQARKKSARRVDGPTARLEDKLRTLSSGIPSIDKAQNLVVSRIIDPAQILSQQATLTSAIEACQVFDRREEGWRKVELKPEKARLAA